MIDDEPADERAKRDRTARLLNVVAILQAHGQTGVTPSEIARRTGTSRRTVYRDLQAIQRELAMPVWSDSGRWGMEGAAFLPPLRLTLQEAMAVFLSARLVTRFMDKHDPHLASAFTKLKEAVPAALGAQVERTIMDLADRPLDADYNRHVEDLTRAWAERRPVRFTYAPAAYGGAEPPPRTAIVRPYLLEPSLATHALYLIGWDEDRGAMRTFKVERIRDLAMLPRTFEEPEEDVVAPPRSGLGHHLGPARDGGRAAVRAGSRGPRGRGDVAPESARRRSRPTGRWRGGPPSRGPSRSASGSCRGVTRSKCWRRRRCAGTSPTTQHRAAGRNGGVSRGRALSGRRVRPVRRGQPDQRPDPRLYRADQAARLRTRRAPPACPRRTWPRRTCSTRPGSSACAGSASSRAPAGSSRPPSTRGSPTASA